ncbi:hypothetical protein D3C76_1601390 [compost metagenome]
MPPAPTSFNTTTRSSLLIPSNLRNIPSARPSGLATTVPVGLVVWNVRSSTSPLPIVSPATPFAELDTLTQDDAWVNSSPLVKMLVLAPPVCRLLVPVPPPGSDTPLNWT